MERESVRVNSWGIPSDGTPCGCAEEASAAESSRAEGMFSGIKVEHKVTFGELLTVIT